MTPRSPLIYTRMEIPKVTSLPVFPLLCNFLHLPSLTPSDIIIYLVNPRWCIKTRSLSILSFPSNQTLTPHTPLTSSSKHSDFNVNHFRGFPNLDSSCFDFRLITQNRLKKGVIGKFPFFIISVTKKVIIYVSCRGINRHRQSFLLSKQKFSLTHPGPHRVRT